MEALTNVIAETTEFEVNRVTLGKTNGKYVTKLVAKTSKEVLGMSYERSITLYTSLTNELEIGKKIPVDPSLFMFEVYDAPLRDDSGEPTGEVVPCKWIFPA